MSVIPHNPVFAGMVASVAIWIGTAFDGLGQQPMPSRWWSPSQPERPHLELPSYEGPFVMDEVPADPVVVPAAASNRICVVVEDALYASISSGISQLSEDLKAAGHSTAIYRFTSGNAQNLRSYLAARYNEAASLDGAILIGNLPYVVYELLQNWGGADEYEDFACDIFYMDLNGTWRDTNATPPFVQGKLDTWTGDKAIEIWVSRIRVDNLGRLGSPDQVVNAYLTKNHAYRVRNWKSSVKALSYNDDDWANLGPSDRDAIDTVYPETTAMVNGTNETTMADYRDHRLPQSFELISTRSHGSPGGHGYIQHNPSQYVFFDATNYVSMTPNSQFYSFFVCSGADYSAANNLAGLAVFSTNRSGLLAWGSTKTGGMWNDDSFYGALAGRESFGRAFRTWFNTNRQAGWAPQWWYGMVLIGDASLHPSPHVAPLHTFRLNAVALTNQVVLNWTDPLLCGMSTNVIQIRHGTATYPANLADGESIYLGTDRFFIHSNVTAGSTHYYTIWVSHDGSTFFAPP